MLNEVKHLDVNAMHHCEMLHYVQHDVDMR
jgi:hypothetical protein